MCGICGTAGFSNQGLLERMTRSMTHRGPDDEGYFLDNNVGLGIRRLSIIDLDTGHQPIHSENQNLCVVFNGEIYNYREIAKRLEQKGHRFYTKSDTEVIIHLYEEKGEDCVQDLNGMFAFAIWDKAKEKLFIARDRLGVKPLYYTFKNGNLIFASELKAILEFEEITREIDSKAIDYFMTFLYIPAPLTIFKEIKKLPAGHILVYQNHNLTTRQYWDISFEPLKEQSEDFYVERIRALLKESVASRLISDVPLGVFLSGGIDSSAIVALVSQLKSNPVKTFTIGYDKQHASYNELRNARLIAQRFNTEHHEFIVKPDLLQILPKLAWHLDEPFADSSAVPTFLVSEIARQHIKVALSGIGGDEGFAGYPRYLGVHLSRYYQNLPLFLRKAAIGIAALFPESTQSRNIGGWAKRFAAGGVLSAEERYIGWVSVLQREERSKLHSPAFLNTLTHHDPQWIHLQYAKRTEGIDPLNAAYSLDIKTYLPDDLLFMGDRMSMANSLELREPFCDYKLLEFSLSIPPGLKLKGFTLKYLLKKALKDMLPAHIIQGRKHGFMMPIGQWLKEDLKNWTLDLLSETNIRKRGYFNYEYIKSMLNEHYCGRRNFDDRIWSLIMLELWHQVYIDKKYGF
jgi:asparagine synthase (glutamine-hydrolysing)